MNQVKKTMQSLAEDTTITKQDFLLSILVGVLAGIIFGMLISPRKYMHIGCNNGNSYDSFDDELEAE